MDFSNSKSSSSASGHKRTSRRTIFAINQGVIDSNKMNLRSKKNNPVSRNGQFKTGKITYDKPAYLNSIGTPEREDIKQKKKNHQSRYNTDSYKAEIEERNYQNNYNRNQWYEDINQIPFTPVQNFQEETSEEIQNEEYTEEANTNDMLRSNIKKENLENIHPNDMTTESRIEVGTECLTESNMIEDSHVKWDPIASAEAGAKAHERFEEEDRQIKQEAIEQELAAENAARNIHKEIDFYKQKLEGIPGSQRYLSRKIPNVEKMCDQKDMFTENDIFGVWDALLHDIDRLIEHHEMAVLDEEEEEKDTKE
jgi:hypothetical protein